MTSSNTLKKILTVGFTALLAVATNLVATDAANAAVATVTSLTVSPTGNVSSTGNLYATTWGAWTGIPNNYAGGGPSINGWKICDTAPTVTHSEDGLDMPSAWNCQFVYTSLSGSSQYTGTSLTLSLVTALGSQSGTVSNASLVGKYVVRFDMSKNLTDNTIYGWVISTPQLIVTPPPTLTGNSGNVNGTVGTILTMAPHTTSGLTTPIVYSYTIGGGASLPAGLAFSSTTGLFAGTPTVAASNVMVTITATGANSLTATESFNLTITSGGGGGGVVPPVSYTMLTAPSYSITNGVATANDGTWSGGTTTRWWILCDNPHTSSASIPPMDCEPVSLTGTNGSEERGPTMTLAASVWKGFGTSAVRVNFADKYFALYVSNGSSRYVTPTAAGPASAPVSAAPLSPEQARNVLKPLPVLVQPLVPALTALSKPLNMAGGKLDVKAGDFNGLVSATIAGKSLEFNLANTGGLTFTVPKGEAGKTADLVLTFGTGTVIIADAIKYVAPVVVAEVPVRPVAIAAGAKKLSEAATDSIRQAAFANLKNTNIQCIGYAANNSASAQAAARLTAVQACDVAIKANPDLKASDVVVVVDKTKAATAGVGIKVYK